MQIFARCQMLNPNRVATFDKFTAENSVNLFSPYDSECESERLPAIKFVGSDKPNGPVAVNILFLLGASHRLLTRPSAISYVMRMQPNVIVDIS